MTARSSRCSPSCCCAGPQTPGEIKTRSERMAPASLDEVEQRLDELGERGYVRRLERRPGQKEERFAHQLGPDEATERQDPVTAHRPRPVTRAAAVPPSRHPPRAPGRRPLRRSPRGSPRWSQRWPPCVRS